MGQNLRIKLTKLIEKLPDATVSSFLEQAESYKTAQTDAGRPACPYCGNTYIVKNGHKREKKEYRCKECGSTFVSTTNTIMSESHQHRELWEEVTSDTLRSNAIDYPIKHRVTVSSICVIRSFSSFGIRLSLRMLQNLMKLMCWNLTKERLFPMELAETPENMGQKT